MKLLKQVVGIDVAMAELVCSLGVFSDNLEVKLKSNDVFKNNEKGFVKLIKWIEKIATPETEVFFSLWKLQAFTMKSSHIGFTKDLKSLL